MVLPVLGNVRKRGKMVYKALEKGDRTDIVKLVACLYKNIKSVAQKSMDVDKELQRLNMMERSLINKLEGIISEIPEIPKGWDAETISRGLTNCIPYVGGLVEKLIFSNKDKKEVKQLMFFFYILGSQIQKIKKEKIDVSFFESEECYVLFKKVLERIRFENRETKIHLFKNFILKSLLKEELAPREGVDKEYILYKIENLDVTHFQIIEWYFKNNVLDSNQIGSDYKVKKEELSKITKFYQEFENDLMVTGFLEDVSAGRLGGGHFYIPSKICRIVYNFIKYDDELA